VDYSGYVKNEHTAGGAHLCSVKILTIPLNGAFTGLIRLL